MANINTLFSLRQYMCFMALTVLPLEGNVHTISTSSNVSIHCVADHGCSIRDYFECVLPAPAVSNKSGDFMAVCDCPAACNVTSYNADLSYAALSLEGIDLLLSENRNAIQRKHITARELQLRVNSEALIGIFQKLDRLQQSVADFVLFWRAKVERAETSSVRRIEAALGKSIDMANHDIDQLFRNLSRYETFYRKRLEIRREWMSTALETIAGNLRDAYNEVSVMCSDHAQRNIHYTIIAVDAAVSFLRNYGTLAEFGDEFDDSEEYFLPTNAVLEKNSNENCAQSNRLKTLRRALVNMYYGLNAPDCDVTLAAIYADFVDIRAGISTCLHEYINYITDTQQWLYTARPSYNTRYVCIVIANVMLIGARSRPGGKAIGS
jgi:hypothetical protein